MKKPMGIVLGLGTLIVACLVLIQLNRPSAGTSPLSLPSPKANEEADYQLKISARQLSPGQPDLLLLGLSGILSQTIQRSGETVSTWKDISELIVSGEPIPPASIRAVLGRPAVTTITGDAVTHYLGEDFPKSLFRIQLGVLQKIFVAIPPVLNKVIQKTETEDMGDFLAEYTALEHKDFIAVDKTWKSYARKDISVDPKQNTLRYTMSKDGRLLRLQGLLSLTQNRASGFKKFVVEIAVEHISSKPASQSTIAKSELKVADRDRAQKLSNQIELENGLSYSEAMRKLDLLSDKSDSQELYHIFSAIKADLRATPARAAELVKKIKDSPERDASTRRQLTVLFGALAQSDHAEVSDDLAALARDCPDSFCKVQAMAALNDHTKPSVASAEKMLEFADENPDVEIAATAALAAGSIARKIDASLPELPNHILRLYNDPSKAAMKSSLIAAMGNHGHRLYIPALQESLGSNDAAIRAAAAYSLRSIPGDAANGAIVRVVESESNPSVILEAMKAMASRSMTAAEYTAVATKTAAFDQDLQQDAARLLVDAYRIDPKDLDASLKILRDKSQFVAIKSYIDAEISAFEAR